MNNGNRWENPKGPVLGMASEKIMDPRRDVVTLWENKSDHRVEVGMEVGPHLAASIRKFIIHYS